MNDALPRPQASTQKPQFLLYFHLIDVTDDSQSRPMQQMIKIQKTKEETSYCARDKP